MSTKQTSIHIRRRGGIYVAVLGAGMLITLIGLTSLAAMRIERLAFATAADGQQARLHAQSAVEIAAQWVSDDPSWRATRSSGTWITDLAMDGSRMTVEGLDPIDGNFLNRPTDPLVLRATAVRGRARQIVEATLDASGTPLDVLQTTIFTRGELRIRAGATLDIAGGPAATGGTLRNDGTISGDAECLLSIGTGTVSGTVRIASSGRSTPHSATVSMYADLGQPIALGSLIDRRLLAPALNPWGEPSPDGVYVIYSSSDLTIRDSRIYGTLVIIAPGRTVTIAGNVLMQNARADYPALLVDGDLNLQFSCETDLSESTLGINFNPPGAPFEGVSNATATDAFPSEIRGLVHATGRLIASGRPRVRGLIIAESAESAAAVDIQNNLSIVHDPQLASNPPMGYMETISMTIRPRGWRQIVLP
jgi:hypothetical protein